MPDRRWSRRPVAAFALTAGALTLAVASPTVSAQEEPTVSDPKQWEESRFDAPLVDPTSTVTAESFEISGTFVKVPHNAAERIVRIHVDFQPGETVPTSAPTTSQPQARCVPDDPDPQVVSAAPESGKIRAPFSIEPEDSVWPCNGVFTLRARAQSNQEAATYDMVRTLRVEVPPAPVPSMEATVAGGEDAPDPETGATADDPATVEVSWQQLESPDTDYPDFVGYRVQRAGPAGDSKFETVGNEVIDHDPELVTQDVPQQVTDTIEAPGVYRYRVQSLRAGPDGTGPTQVVAASVEEPVSVEIAGPPTTTTSTTAAPPTTRQPLALPDVGSGSNNPRSPLAIPSAPTTIDTGFDEELDYGDLPEPGEELAGEGQSVIQTEGEGAGLLGPVAGAMVLLGWAGHVAYLNRLAKQF